MKQTYRFAPLSRGEQEFLEMVLMEELELQVWVVITYSIVMGEEVLVSIQ